ncbi:MAG: NAD(P)-dependent oxidoreductase [Deltaproteobacteria bacterium]
MKIAIFDVEIQELQKFSDKLSTHTIKTFGKNIADVDLSEYADSQVISVFVHSNITRDMIQKMPDLKFIATRSTGFEHIDLEACKERSIKVSNVPFYGENTVAEHTFALILCLSRNIHKTYVRTINNNFSLTNLQGFDLKGKTLGVIGAGKIGLHVIRMAKGFGMEVLAFDVIKNSFMAEILGFEYADIEYILRNSDVISLHAPLNKSTYHLINKNNINIIKKGAVIVNTSRGGLIEAEALLEALDNGIIAGAGLDVFEGEEYLFEEGCKLREDYSDDVKKLVSQNCSLLHRENVVITPHNAFNSLEAVDRIFNTTIDNINKFVSGTPINTIN